MELVIEQWNKMHLIILGAFLVVLVLFGLILRRKGQDTQNKVLIVLAFINLAIHFLKLLIPQYKDDLPISYREVTFQNICTATIIMMPFIMLCKNKIMKDYLFYIGLLVGLAALVYPTEAIGRSIEELDVIRFYICNVLLFIVPFYMVVFGIHELDIKRVPLFPLVFLLVECLILANEVILMEAGFVEFRGSMGFMDYNYRNSNFIFGPTEDLKEISDKFIEPLVPKVFKTVPAGVYQGEAKYIPVLWMLVPCFVYFTAIGGVLCFIFTKLFKRASYNKF